MGGNGGDGGPGSGSLPVGGDGGNGGTGIGGGLYITATNGSSSGFVLNCTFAQNGAFGGTNGAAGTGAFPGNAGSPGAHRGANLANAGSSAAVTIMNSLLATNLTSFGSGYYGPGAVDGGYNISWDRSLKTNSGTSFQTYDLKIGSLADNGGPTKTIALLAASPALDRIPSDMAPNSDQRGAERPQGPRSDVGAYEANFQPVILTEPQSQSQTNGGKVTFFVVAGGASPLGYRWLFNNAPIQNAASSNYTILHVGATNAGDYRVIVTNGFGSVTSAVATLTISDLAAVYSISGRVFDIGGSNGLSGVTVSGAGTNSATTDASGNYMISRVSAGDYFIFASRPGYIFGPAQEVILGPNATNLNFYASNRVYTISGQVINSTNGAGLSGVSIAVTLVGTIQTDENGFFALSQPSNTYTLTPSKHNYSFSPSSLTVTIPPDATNLQFLGSTFVIASAATTNGAVHFTVLSPAGQTRIEASTNLKDWISIYTNSGNFQFSDPSSANFPNRFYRAVRP
jgi:hypothetical protein